MQTTRDLVGVLVELAAGVQHAHDDFSRGTFGLVLVVKLDAGRNPAAVVCHGDRIVGMNGDNDVVTMPGECFVDRVIDDFKHHVVQAGAIGRIADVHPGTLADSFQALKLLNARFIVGGRANLFNHAFSSFVSRETKVQCVRLRTG